MCVCVGGGGGGGGGDYGIITLSKIGLDTELS